jgi:hypothetical protein
MGLINALISGIGYVASAFLLLLPTTPFTWQLGGLSSYWHYVTVFIPIPEMITLLNAYLVAVLSYYAIRAILRFTKQIE